MKAGEAFSWGQSVSRRRFLRGAAGISLTLPWLESLPLLAADTAVALGKRILGKPVDCAHAKEMLEALSGQTHHVLTAIAVAAQIGIQVRVSTTMVRFRHISEREIRAYLAHGEAQDKAGAYAIQGRAAVFVSAISGSYSGVVGLPLYETAELLEDYGYRFLPEMY